MDDFIILFWFFIYINFLIDLSFLGGAKWAKLWTL